MRSHGWPERQKPRYCLICCLPGPHAFNDGGAGYVPHIYDSGDRRFGDLGPSARRSRKASRVPRGMIPAT